MLEKPRLSFNKQREALAQAASAAAVQSDNGFGQAMSSAQSLLEGFSRSVKMVQPEAGNGVTAEALEALWNGRNSGLADGLEGIKGQIAGIADQPNLTNNPKIDYGKFKPNSEFTSLLIETAQELGADPVDLATAISYETAGTFDPTKAGPTTQWGQHKGLIQFGEPQAQQHGVDWNDPLRSQLGKGKAVSRYFQSNGWKPGMAGIDLYSIINAGAPGRYDASDANNGGAPGSVRDKWENQMQGHRQKALALLGLA